MLQKNEKFDIARLACYKLCDDLNLSSIKAARYYKESPIIYQRYLERLKEYNIAILDYSSKVLNCLVKYVENDNIEILQQELEKICNDVHSFYNKFSNNETLTNIGFDTLINHKNIIYETLNESFEERKIKLIPYSTFANRGEADMSVWLKLAR